MGRQVLGLSMGLGSRDCLSSCIRANRAPRRLSSSTTTFPRTHLGKRMHSIPSLHGSFLHYSLLHLGMPLSVTAQDSFPQLGMNTFCLSCPRLGGFCSSVFLSMLYRRSYKLFCQIFYFHIGVKI